MVNSSSQTLPIMPHLVANTQPLRAIHTTAAPALNLPPQTLPPMPHLINQNTQASLPQDAFQKQGASQQQIIPSTPPQAEPSASANSDQALVNQLEQFLKDDAAQKAGQNPNASTDDPGQKTLKDMSDEELAALLDQKTQEEAQAKQDEAAQKAAALSAASAANYTQDTSNTNEGELAKSQQSTDGSKKTDSVNTDAAANNTTPTDDANTSGKDTADKQVTDSTKESDASQNPKSGHIAAPEVENKTIENTSKTEIKPKEASTVTTIEQKSKTETQQQPEKKSSIVRLAAFVGIAALAIWGAVKGVNVWRNRNQAKDAIDELAPEESKHLFEHIRDWIHGGKISNSFKTAYYDLVDKIPGMGSHELNDLANQVKLDAGTKRMLSQALRWEQSLRQASRTRAGADPTRMYHIQQAQKLITSYKLGVVNRALENAGGKEATRSLADVANESAARARIEDVQVGNLVREDLLSTLGADPAMSAEAELNLLEALLHMRDANVMSDHRLAPFAKSIAHEIDSSHPNRFGAQVLLQRAGAWQSSTAVPFGNTGFFKRNPESSFQRLKDAFYNLRRF